MAQHGVDHYRYSGGDEVSSLINTDSEYYPAFAYIVGVLLGLISGILITVAYFNLKPI